MNLNRTYQSLQPERLRVKTLKSNVRKPERDLHWLGKLQFQFKDFEQSASVKLSSIGLLINYQNIVLEDLTLNYKFSVLSFLRLMTGSTSNGRRKCWRENVSTPIYVQCYNMLIKDIAVKNLYLLLSCLTSIFDLSDPKPLASKRECWGVTDEMGSNLETHRILQVACNSVWPYDLFARHWASQWTVQDRRAYIAVLFFFSNNDSGESGDLALAASGRLLNLKMALEH